MLNPPPLEDEVININISMRIEFILFTEFVKQTSSKLDFTPKYSDYVSVLPEKKKHQTKKNKNQKQNFSSFFIILFLPSYLIYQ